MSTNQFLHTGISQAYWCKQDQDEAKFEEAKLKIPNNEDQNIAWFDYLFEKKGIFLPTGNEKAITLLISGPPGSGKTTLALELCFRMAQLHKFISLYISTESTTNQLKDKFNSFGFLNSRNTILEFNKSIKNIKDLRPVMLWGQEKIKKWGTFYDIVSESLQEAGRILSNIDLPNSIISELRRLIVTPTGNIPLSMNPDILVIDSLNLIEDSEQNKYFEEVLKKKGRTKLVIVVLDTSKDKGISKPFEFVSDNIIRLDYRYLSLDNTSLRDYYLRTIEIVKARYQGHVLGRQQMKIYSKFEIDKEDRNINAIMKRAHPYRTEGGIFIYPSIHYYLSLYKKRALIEDQEKNYYVATPIEKLNETIGGGFPKGRCTAFLGCRGGHKSHLGYLHILNLIRNDADSAGLIISLRDDEIMTKRTLTSILIDEYFKEDPNISEEESKNAALREISEFEKQNQLEILYYPPGYITPDEFFHRMYMAIHRLKNSNKKITLLFHSLDQISARFPLCSHQPIFIPAIIETLSGECISSIFIAVDEPGQPTAQYGLLPMADLILTFNRISIPYKKYYDQHKESWKIDTNNISKEEILKKHREHNKEVIVMQVSRFSGGQQAGKMGLLELVKINELNDSIIAKPGLHFTKLSMRFDYNSYLLQTRK